jgi:hypothetical protein
MTTEQESAEAELKLPALKVVEPRVNVVSPWTDDELDRKRIAERSL